MLRLLTAAGLAAQAANIRGAVRAAVGRAVLAALAMLFLLAAAAFALVAGYFALAPQLGQTGAAGAIAGALLLVALILFVLARNLPRRALGGTDSGIVEDVKARYRAAARAAGTGSPLANPIVLLAGAALLAGYLAGRRSGERD